MPPLSHNRKANVNGQQGKYALISMPWFWAYMPSIQLAIVKDLLDKCGIESEVFEFYTDLLDKVGPNVYKSLANDSGFAGELAFSQFYFSDHNQQWASARPTLGLADKQTEDHLFAFISPVIEKFVDDCASKTNWRDFQTACFTLTATQTSASMLLARRIKQINPDIFIVFGGTSCAGPMGRAIAELCPDVDVVVHTEAEATVQPLAVAIETKTWFGTIPGITWRRGTELVTNGGTCLHGFSESRGPLNFDSYFKRIRANGAEKHFKPWIPFESSRGCWYGEKVQCTFCGLNEVIEYRERQTSHLADELEGYQMRYGVDRFFATDLIMPRSFFKTTLSDIEAKSNGWTLFYEVKSNMKRAEIEQLARAGVRWIQPGIESLEDSALKKMKKGVSAAQNLQTLKWCKEFGIQASWNLITGFPGETSVQYKELNTLLRKLFHLRPPAGVGDFEVHRFSPYFDDPQSFGISLHGADPRYRAVYPISQDLLDSLVYRYAYSIHDGEPLDLLLERQSLRRVVDEWWRRAPANPRLDCMRLDDGEAVIIDTRLGDPGSVRTLQKAQAELFLYVDQARPCKSICESFRRDRADAHFALGGDTGLCELLDAWIADGFIVQLSNHYLSLAVRVKPGQEAHNKGEEDVE